MGSMSMATNAIMATAITWALMCCLAYNHNTTNAMAMNTNERHASLLKRAALSRGKVSFKNAYSPIKRASLGAVKLPASEGKTANTKQMPPVMPAAIYSGLSEGCCLSSHHCFKAKNAMMHMHKQLMVRVMDTVLNWAYMGT